MPPSTAGDTPRQKQRDQSIATSGAAPRTLDESLAGAGAAVDADVEVEVDDVVDVDVDVDVDVAPVADAGDNHGRHTFDRGNVKRHAVSPVSHSSPAERASGKRRRQYSYSSADNWTAARASASPVLFSQLGSVRSMTMSATSSSAAASSASASSTAAAAVAAASSSSSSAAAAAASPGGARAPTFEIVIDCDDSDGDSSDECFVVDSCESQQLVDDDDNDNEDGDDSDNRDAARRDHVASDEKLARQLQLQLTRELNQHTRTLSDIREEQRLRRQRLADATGVSGDGAAAAAGGRSGDGAAAAASGYSGEGAAAARGLSGESKESGAMNTADDAMTDEELAQMIHADEIARVASARKSPFRKDTTASDEELARKCHEREVLGAARWAASTSAASASEGAPSSSSAYGYNNKADVEWRLQRDEELARQLQDGDATVEVGHGARLADSDAELARALQEAEDAEARAAR
jgi:hypothetical protein